MPVTNCHPLPGPKVQAPLVICPFFCSPPSSVFCSPQIHLFILPLLTNPPALLMLLCGILILCRGPLSFHLSPKHSLYLVCFHFRSWVVHCPSAHMMGGVGRMGISATFFLIYTAAFRLLPLHLCINTPPVISSVCSSLSFPCHGYY